MTDDFAVLDFILVAAPVPRVAIALAQSLPTPSEKPKTGLLSRLLGRGTQKNTSRTLTVHPVTSIPEAPLARMDFDPANDDEPITMRLSGPIDTSGMTLIEFIEPEIGQSAIALALSTELPGAELFYFRYSGALHPGADFAFHVYQDGRIVRRAASISFSGTSPEAQWTATDKGMPHPMETDSLPATATPQSEIMTPQRQASILTSLGIKPDTLFSTHATRESLAVLSTADGGKPVSSLRVLKSPPPRAPKVSPTPTQNAPLPPTQPEPEPTPTPTPPLHSAEWEISVTTLLLEAVDAGLPEEERVPWLESLTQKLNDGRVEQALQAAVILIDQGERPAHVRADAARRLRALYAHLLET